MGIRVKALQRGYYGSLREEGDEFSIAKAEDMGSWMLALDRLPEKPRRGRQAENAQPPPQDDDSLGLE